MAAGKPMRALALPSTTGMGTPTLSHGGSWALAGHTRTSRAGGPTARPATIGWVGPAGVREGTATGPRQGVLPVEEAGLEHAAALSIGRARAGACCRWSRVAA